MPRSTRNKFDVQQQIRKRVIRDARSRNSSKSGAKRMNEIKQKQEKMSSDVMLDELLEKICIRNGNKKTILLTVGNLGYMNLLVNWWLSVNKNTELAQHSLIITYDDILVNNMIKKLPFCNVAHLPYKTVQNQKISEKAVSFKRNGWDEITRFKLKAIHYLLSNGYTVYYVDPDVYMIKNSLKLLDKLIYGDTKVLIQQGKPYCSGVIYAPPNDITKKLFSPKEWSVCGTDDENYIIRFFNSKYPELNKHISVLDIDCFPNGLKWKHDYNPKRVHELIKDNKIELLHFNYVSGIENKITKMRQYNMWHKQMNIIGVPKEFQPNLNDVCLKKNKSVYPPHQSGPQIESYTYEYMKTYLKTKTISSNYDYLPIFWTGISVNGEHHLIDKLKVWLRGFIKKYPNRRCWTVVQHCKSIQRTCGLVLPKNWIIFSTSDPNAVKTTDNHPTQIDTVKYIPIKKRKMMYWHKTGFGRMTAAPPGKKYIPKKIPLKSIEVVNDEQSPLKETKNSKYYTQNHITIPLLSSVHEQAKKAIWEGSRTVLATFIGNINVHPMRGLMEKVLSKRNRIIIESGKYKHNENVDRFDELMLNSTFALCPRGYGNTSFRLVEAMQFGTIPVYISDVFSLPYKDQIDWQKIAIIASPNDLPKLYFKLVEIETNQVLIDNYRTEIKKVFKKYFTMEGCCENMIHYITK